MENSFDSAHPAFVHRKSFGNIERPEPVERELTMTPWGFISRHETQVVNRGNAAAALRVQGETTVRRARPCGSCRSRGAWASPIPTASSTTSSPTPRRSTITR